MEVITGAETPEYLRGPYGGENGTAVTTTKNIATRVKGDTGHTVQDTRAESYPNKNSKETQDKHKRLEKNSKSVESETESKEIKALPAPVGPRRGQVVQVWFGRKKRSSRGNKEAKIEAEQPQETQMENIQDSPSKNAEDINGIEDVEDIEDVNDEENMEVIEDMEVSRIWKMLEISKTWRTSKTLKILIPLKILKVLMTSRSKNLMIWKRWKEQKL